MPEWEDMKRALSEALDERTRIDAETHAAHHSYIADLIRRNEERDKRRTERRERVLQQILGWGLIALLTASGAAAYKAAEAWLKAIVGK